MPPLACASNAASRPSSAEETWSRSSARCCERLDAWRDSLPARVDPHLSAVVETVEKFAAGIGKGCSHVVISLRAAMNYAFAGSDWAAMLNTQPDRIGSGETDAKYSANLRRSSIS